MRHLHVVELCQQTFLFLLSHKCKVPEMMNNNTHLRVCKFHIMRVFIMHVIRLIRQVSHKNANKLVTPHFEKIYFVMISQNKLTTLSEVSGILTDLT